jgi:DNA-binding MarR family transcriptional regulator
MSVRHQLNVRPRPGPAAADHPLGFLLADLIRLMRADFRQRAAGLRLTPALSRLLFYVDQRPGCSQAELASFLDVTSVTIGRMIDRLEASGFVRRRADAHDRRAFRIHLDKAARPVVARMNRILEQTTARATRGMPKREYASLLRALQLLRTNLESAGA